MRPDLAFSALVAVAASCVASPPGNAGAGLGYDAYGLDLHPERFCDLEDGAPVSDACYGYVGATIEMVMTEHDVPRPDPQWWRPACIPRGVKVADVVARIRPLLRPPRMCGGLCTDTGSVRDALVEAYPCER